MSAFLTLLLLGLTLQAQINPAARRISTPVFASSSLNTGLIAYWKLDETSGTRVDSEPTGTLQNLADNNTVLYNTGKLGNAADFVRAANESLSIADSSDLSTGPISFSVTFWAYLIGKGTGSQLRVIACKDVVSNGEREWGCFYDTSSDRFRFYTGRPATTTADFVNADTLGSPSLNVWYFIAVRHDQSAGFNYISVNAGSQDSAAFTTGPPDSTSAFRIGDLDNATEYNWEGRIDEVAFYKKALSAAEITALYGAGTPPACCPFVVIP